MSDLAHSNSTAPGASAAGRAISSGAMRGGHSPAKLPLSKHLAQDAQNAPAVLSATAGTVLDRTIRTGSFPVAQASSLILPLVNKTVAKTLSAFNPLKLLKL